MKIEFIGAARNVTGSKHLLHINGKRILLDCGLFQGHRKEAEEANRYLPFDATKIDALVLSHAHIDHAGAIPFLVKHGFTGPIYCTHATRDLCSVMLKDSARIHTSEAQYLNEKKNMNVQPLYTEEDAANAMTFFRSVGYGQKVIIDQNIKFTFHDAGHILGSACEEWEIYDNDTDQEIRFGFSGDLGRKHLPILRAPQQIKNLDTFITESTYGNRLHNEMEDIEDDLINKINETSRKGGKILIPAFAVERTQEVLYVLRSLMMRGKIDKLPIYIDSPLATKATEIFRLHPECFDEDMTAIHEAGFFPFLEGEGVRFTRSVSESKFLNKAHFPCIIVSASGMCEFGRITHHLKNGLPDKRNLLLCIGFMAQHTLGRKLVDGEKEVKIHGEIVKVNASIAMFNAFSGHADLNGLKDYASGVGGPKNVFLVHGEKDSMENFKGELSKLDNLKKSIIDIPEPGDIYELMSDKTFRKTPKRNMECNGIVCQVAEYK